MAKGKTVSLSLRRKIVDEYRAGRPPSLLAKKHNVSTGSIFRWAKLKPNAPKLSSAQKRDARRKKPDAIELVVDDLLGGIRERLIVSIRELVTIGAKQRLDALIATLTERVVAVS